ncbi:FAD-binding protein [Marisediminicola senii]|uniref:FAD-binding protein n=1 Tax=Marisediminicola senii TaxID=2711233 RepID=UPI0013ED050E|nr:FAD-binding protein [Marisediminicola senii]
MFDNTPPTGRIETRDAHDVVAIDRRFDVPVAELWSHLTVSDRTARWIGPWQGDASTGPIDVTWTAEDGSPVEQLRVLTCQRPSLLVVETVGDDPWHLELSVEELPGSRSLLTLRQRLSDTVQPSTVGGGWEFYLDRLAAAVAGREPQPFGGYDDTVERHYSGLDAAAGRTDSDAGEGGTETDGSGTGGASDGSSAGSAHVGQLDLTDLRAQVTGVVLTPGDPGFAEEVAAFNLGVVHSPAVVVGAASTSDVAAAVRFAAAHSLPLRVQATGHGAFVAATDGLMITTRRLAAVDVNPHTRIATIGAGQKWRAVHAAAAPFGLTPIPGSSPDVGAVGYTLGGGLGPLSRSHGFTSDWVRSFTVVDGEGAVLEASAVSNVDLFWALRGGKGGLGIVTEMQLELALLPTVYGGSIFFAEEHIEAVLRGWLDWTETASDDVTTSVAIMRLPPLEFIPEPLRGRTVVNLRFAYPGTDDEGARLAAPLRALAPAVIDAVGPLPTYQLGTIHNDPDQPGAVWDRGMMLSFADQEFAGELLRHVGAGIHSPFVSCEIRHLGGRTAIDVPEGSAVGGRSGAFTLILLGVDPTLFDSVLPEAADAAIEDIEKWVSPETTINFAGAIHSEREFASAWPHDIFDRLAEVRQRYDPQRVFAFGPLVDA